jgi:hypothetical protein
MAHSMPLSLAMHAYICTHTRHTDMQTMLGSSYRTSHIYELCEFRHTAPVAAVAVAVAATLPRVRRRL